ncbi:hypothetical protein G6M50_06405 [Agrobacterium rhizogenes]|nr:hypothetical protein [Rhizobium rhizogenes]NTJ77435.1 hypothetical protein [Rhizobium rhizogenes]
MDFVDELVDIHRKILSSTRVQTENGPGAKLVITYAKAAAIDTAARRIEELERQLDRFRSDRSYIIGFNDGWSSAVEEAAKIADDHAKSECSGMGSETEAMRLGARSIASAIRALSDSSPTLLQEQKDNAGKEGE